MRDGPEHNEAWQYESKDGVLTVRTSSNAKDDLTVQFSSTELRWEGFRIHFKLGLFHKDVPLRRKGNKVSAKVVVPKQERTKQKRKISIEVKADS